MYIIFHIGKTGGETLGKFLKKHNIPCSFVHVQKTKEKSIKILKRKTKNKIITIRDPIDRIISIFNFWKSLLGTDYHKSHTRMISKYFKKFNSINDLVDGLRKQDKTAIEAYETIIHFRQGYTYYLGCVDNIEKNKHAIFYIIQLENYKEDFDKLHNYLSKKYSFSFDSNYLETSKIKYNYPKETYLSEENKIFLKEFLKEEYTIYDYLVSIKKEINNKI